MSDRQAHPLHRLAAGFVLAVLALGTLFLWLGIPVLGTWALGQVLDSKNGHYVAGLLGVPLAMVAFAPVLFWLNGLYLRIRASEEGWDEEWDAQDQEPRLIPRGPLEPLLMISLAVSLVALIVWFFFFAENPLLTT